MSAKKLLVLYIVTLRNLIGLVTGTVTGGSTIPLNVNTTEGTVLIRIALLIFFITLVTDIVMVKITTLQSVDMMGEIAANSIRSILAAMLIFLAH